MPPVGFEPTISAGERTHTYALDRAATGTGILLDSYSSFFLSFLLGHPNNICPLDEWSARHRGLYLTTHNNYNR